MTAYTNIESCVFCDYPDCSEGYQMHDASKGVTRSTSHEEGWVSRREGGHLLDYCPEHALSDY